MSFLIYGDRGSGAFSAEAALAEAGAHYEFRPVSLKLNEQRAPAFLAINPSGKMPALQLPEGGVVTESLAILVMLAERFPDFPLLREGLLVRLSSITSSSGTIPGAIDFSTDIRPWLGKEAALAVLSTGTSTTAALIVLDVTDLARARRFLARFSPTSQSSYRGSAIQRHRHAGRDQQHAHDEGQRQEQVDDPAPQVEIEVAQVPIAAQSTDDRQ